MNRKPLKDGDIIALLKSASSEAVSFHDSTLSKEREEVLKYYDADKPYSTARNNSKYVSQDVYDATEQAVAALADVFTGGSGLGRFTPRGPEDVALCQQATAYCDHVIFQKNPGHEIITNAIRDGFMNRNAIGKIYWEEEDEYYTEEFENLDEDQVLALAEQDSVEDFEELVLDEDSGMYSGELVRKRVCKYPRIENVAPEEFLISPRAKSMDSATIKTHRMLRTKSWLKEKGVPESEIENAITATNEVSEHSPELEQRFRDVDDEINGLNSHPQEQAQMVYVYETYMQLDVDGDGILRYWKFTHTDNYLIDKEPCGWHPFIYFCPIPRPHSFWGTNWAKRIIDTQNAKTILTRGILDHTVATNRPRYKVLKGTLRSARELMDDRFGGVVNVNKLEGIEPLEQANLNPFTFQTIQLLDADKEEQTGVSALATGLNKDAISKQNSADLVQQMTTLSQTRLKLIARNFAEQWVKQMYLRVYALAIEYDDEETILKINGEYVPVRPTDWYERTDFTIEPTVGYGEKEREAQKWLSVDAMLSQSAPGQYGPEEKFATLSKALEFMGVKDVSAHLKKTPPPPQPDPMAIAELEIRKKEVEVRAMEAQIKKAELQLEAASRGYELELKATKQRADFALKSDAQDLKERQHESTKHIAEEELKLLKKDSADNKGIVSPNS